MEHIPGQTVFNIYEKTEPITAGVRDGASLETAIIIEEFEEGKNYKKEEEEEGEGERERVAPVQESDSGDESKHIKYQRFCEMLQTMWAAAPTRNSVEINYMLYCITAYHMAKLGELSPFP